LSPILGIFASANARVYQVGDVGPGGGKVFYVATTTFTGGPSSTQCKYLEAAPTTGTSAWTDAAYVWSGTTGTAIGVTAQGTAIGTGYGNTIAMVTQNNTANRAGTISRAYRGPNNLSDWYLPSKDELNQLYLQKAVVGGTVPDGTFNPSYWSSTERDISSATDVWAHNFLNGIVQPNLKIGSYYVRPIRAF
jgi:hypothetical protein